MNGSNNWESMGILSKNYYSLEANLFFSFPLKITSSGYKVIETLDLTDTMLKYLKATEDELKKERDTVKEFL